MPSSPTTMLKSPSRQSSGGSAISSIAEEGESPPSITFSRQNSQGMVEPPQDIDDRDDAQSMLSRSSTTRTLVSPYRPRTSKELTGYGYASFKDRPSYLEKPDTMYSASLMHKSMPALPQRFSSDEGDIPDAGHSSHTRYDLVAALGEDTLPYTTEIDTIPCAGVRISHGKLKGLMGWRLVVKLGGKEGRFPKHERIPPHLTLYDHHNPYSPAREHYKSYSASATLSPGKVSSSSSCSEEDEKYNTEYGHWSTQVPTPRTSITPAVHTPPGEGYNAVTTNFILDTSQSSSSIPGETLYALGFKPHNVYPGKAVLLRVQGVETRFYVGKDGEAGRLGVQFLEDANVSLVIDREIGPVLYREVSQLNDVPRTVRLSLQQRVRSLLGMNKLS